MSIVDIDMSELRIDEEEEVTTIYVSLMSKMRSEYDAITAMELDEEINANLQIEDEQESAEEEEVKAETNEELEITNGSKTAILRKKEGKTKKERQRRYTVITAITKSKPFSNCWITASVLLLQRSSSE